MIGKNTEGKYHSPDIPYFFCRGNGGQKITKRRGMGLPLSLCDKGPWSNAGVERREYAARIEKEDRRAREEIGTLGNLRSKGPRRNCL